MGVGRLSGFEKAAGFIGWVLKSPGKAVVTVSSFGLKKAVTSRRKNDRNSRAVMRPTKLGLRPRVKAGASRPGAKAKKTTKRHSAFRYVGVGKLAKKV